MDDIRFSCPSCDRHLAAPPDMAGESMACPACGHALCIPTLVPEPPPPVCVAAPEPPPVAPETLPPVYAAVPLPKSISKIQTQKREVVRQAPVRKRAVVTVAKRSKQPDDPGTPAAGRDPRRKRPRIAAVAIPSAFLVIGVLWYAWRVLWNAAPVMGSNGRVADLSFPLIWVGGETFDMGSDSGDADEQPVHAVRISQGYWIGGTEVPNSDYQLFLRASAYNGKSDADGDYLKHVSGGSEMSTDSQHPVVWVSWSNAVAFCNWLTQRERQAGRLPENYIYRLPTEAEWEWAARGGRAQPGYRFSGADDADTVAWYRDNSRGGTQPVGAKRPNELGLLDMSGNVWEWCQDWYQITYTGLAATDPAGPGKGEFRVLRGGGWNGEESHCRSTCRGRMDPSYTTSFLGFRVALAPALAPAGQAK
jgi:formylglycine-generating enzyme required for sulfatase activity